MTSKQVQCIFSMVSNIVGLSFCLVRNFGSSSGFITHLWPGRHLRKSMKIGLWVIPKKSFQIVSSFCSVNFLDSL